MVADDAPAAKAARQRALARSIWFTVPGAHLALGAAWAVVPPLPGMEDAGARLLLALRWLPVALLPYVAVCLWITTARFFEGAHNPLLGAESERLQIHCRVMQNTLEQFVWFAIGLLALAAGFGPAQAPLVPIACTFFGFARFVYWWGYLRRGTLGRAPGVQLTLALNVPLFAAAMLAWSRPLVP